MGLQKCGVKLNRAGKEIKSHGTQEFPCAGYASLYTKEPEIVVPWHWHEELEIVYVNEGTLRLQIPAKSYELKKGDCMVINANIPHYAATDSKCELHSLVFSPQLIMGNNDSVFAKKYLMPLISCPSFTGHPIRKVPLDELGGKLRKVPLDKLGGKLTAEHNEEIQNFTEAFLALSQDAPGFEFIVRTKLSQLCFYLYQQFEQEISTGDIAQNQDTVRIGKMLDFIHTNYANDITLTEIAKVVDVSERECLRCFQRTIQFSPMQYLLKYRITRGAELLLNNPTHSISEISTQCGFDSPSNFSKMFKRFYNCTPREYRG